MARILGVFVSLSLLGGCATTPYSEVTITCANATRHNVLLDDRPRTASDWVVINATACGWQRQVIHRRQ